LAAFYHGAVFDPPDLADQTGFDNQANWEARPLSLFAGNWEDHQASARLAEHDLSALGVPAATCQRVAALIENLEQLRVPQSDGDAAVLVDAAIGQLSVDPQRYKDYLNQVRLENSAVDVAAFVTARMTAMRQLLARERLFWSPGAVQWEAAARDNVLAELAREQAELDKLASQDG
jgi:predicted metal-dependent HD superfamily phosphohydrolase